MGIEKTLQNADHVIVNSENNRYVEQVLTADPHKNKQNLYERLS
jgi:hypothetical protein